MVLGAIAFFIYSCCASWIMMRYKWQTLTVTSSLILVWLFVAFGLWALWLR